MSTKHLAVSNFSDYTFLNKNEYLNQLIDKVHKTKKGDRVLIVTHVLKVNEPIIVNLLNVLIDAAKRGVMIKLALDERSLPVMQRIPINKAQHTLIKSIYFYLNSLKYAGGIYAITNQSYRRIINRYAGRSHIKVSIINDEIFVGGCNLAEVNQIDMMVEWKNLETANWLYEIMSKIMDGKNTLTALGGDDLVLNLDNETKLLLDIGRPKQSIIYDQALNLIDSAKEWIVMTCQFFPNSHTARHLAAAYNRGVNVSLYFNHPSKHQPGHNILHHLVLRHEKALRPPALFKQQLQKDLPFLHAKLLATEQGAMIGSHNFVAAGVNFGTAEITLLSLNEKFSNLAVKHFVQQLGDS